MFWRFVPLFVACFVFSYLDRINISFAKLQMQSELGFCDAMYGFGASVFFVGYFLFEVPSNIVLHRVGAKRWIARIMITWGIASACMMFVHTETWFYVLRFLIGALEAGFVPGALYFFTKWFPSSRRGRINSFFMASIALCGIIGSPLSGAIMKFCDGLNGMPAGNGSSCSKAFRRCCSASSCSLSSMTTSIDAKWLDADEKRALNAQLARDPKVGEVHSLKAAFSEPVTLVMALIYLFLAMGIYGLVFWMPQLVKTAGTSDPFTIGLISMLPYAVAGIGMILIGKHSDRTGERRWHLGACALAGTVGYVLCGFFPGNTVMLVIGLTIAATGHHHVARALLDSADALSHRHRGGERHRADQLGRAVRRHHQPVHGRQGEDDDRQRDARPLRDRVRVPARRDADRVGFAAPSLLPRKRRRVTAYGAQGRSFERPCVQPAA